MQKTALILHGWPQYRLESYFLVKHLKNRGYKMIYPNLFDNRFEFSLPNILHKILEMLGKNEPDVIVGISMGGLILPYIAQKYPDANLIFVASGANIESRSKGFNFVINFLTKSKPLWLLEILLKTPDRLIEGLYKFINPSKNKNEEERMIFKKDMNENICFIKSIPAKKELEIVSFVKSIDNKLLLKDIKNKSLIFSGEEDLLMPKEKGVELHKLLRNSKIVINKGEHFNVFDEKDLVEVDRFLGLKE